MKKNSLSAAVAAKKSPTGFAGMTDVLASGFNVGMLSEGAQRQMFKLEDIEVEPQVREEFEDDENSLNDLGDSLLKEQIQPILLRKNRPGRDKPYLLVAGGRRFMAAELKKIPELWGDYRPEMTDEDAERIQFAENIQRKNLTQIEEAKRIQRDLDTLGSVEAVLAKHNKSRPWLSKIISLLHLPEQAKRLVKENISADPEVINGVKVVEKINPAAAKVLVDDLKQSKGQVEARKKVNDAKAQVKPPKAGKGTKATETAASKTHDIFASAKIDTALPSDTDSEQDEKERPGPPLAPWDILTNAYSLIHEGGAKPKMFLETLTADQRKDVEGWLQSFFDAGRAGKKLAQTVMKGLHDNTFANEGPGAFAMIAFLQGADVEVKAFKAADILNQVSK
jgi:ParB family transcriptional regulator, chromosome partitioning protein